MPLLLFFFLVDGLGRCRRRAALVLPCEQKEEVAAVPEDDRSQCGGQVATGAYNREIDEKIVQIKSICGMD
ncbi:MAG: hypothetical protein JRH10_23035 [Deltaproteobacteria bacterium]|nr:hypothetical protein [Deltaproteobacteria bacterium]MBW2396622.1 hypothetical protein [Deltaproteobacteria bacterium]